MAKTFNCLYENVNQLRDFVEKNELHEYPNLLLQVFTSNRSIDFIQEIQHSVSLLLPNTTMIGCSSAGEIINGAVFNGKTVFSFTSFEKIELSSILLKSEDFLSSYDMGKNLAITLSKFDTKVMILLPTGLHLDGQSLLEGIYAENKEIVIGGGFAGGNGLLKETISFDNERITADGVAAVALHGELIVHSGEKANWKKIGLPLKITKAKGNKIYSINHKKPVQILKHYFGETFIKKLPISSVEFPFLVERQSETIPIFITKLMENGEFELNRTVQEGEHISFAYADIKSIVEQSMLELKRLAKKPPEIFYVYGCMSRRSVIGQITTNELSYLNEIAPTSGFFAYGEISNKKGKCPQQVCHTLTYLAISEFQNNEQKKLVLQYDIPDELNTIISLNHLIESTSKDIQTLNATIEVSEQYYHSLFDNNTDFVYSTDLKGNITSINPAFAKTFGVIESEVKGKSALKFVRPEDVAKVRMHFYRTLKGKEQYYDITIPQKDGTNQIFQIKNIPITVNEEIIGIYGLGRNITEQRKIEETMVQLAYYDQDTGLPNRTKFTELLQDRLVLAKKKKRKLAVVFIDVDRFKIINDNLGHSAGDQVLKGLSERIKTVLPNGAYLGRFGGDKFTVILTKNTEVLDIIKITNLLLNTVKKPILFDEQEFFITASIGVSLFPHDGFDHQTLLKNADIATNRSKNQGGNVTTFYSTDMNEQSTQRLQLETSLRKAIYKNEFYLMYQPLVDLKTGLIFGSEALIRWAHPKWGIVSPDQFIPIAEETGMIDEIGSWVLRTACIQNKKWQEIGLGTLTISVNVSAYQFQQPHFISEVEKALAESKLDPQYLHLELTESIMLRNVSYSITVMKKLQEMGVHVSIDDFGTGYSSLSYLKNLPINTLKIDRSFIHNLRIDTADIAIVQAIIMMGHGLAVKIVAEGVETKEQIQLLQNLNCHFAQGYYIHKPLIVQDFEEELTKSNKINLPKIYK